MNPETLFRAYDFNEQYAYELVKDVGEREMFLTPGPGLENHPAFTLGHLVTGSAGLAEDMGGSFEVPSGWKELFLRTGPGDPRLPDPIGQKYPGKAELLRELSSQHHTVKKLFSGLTRMDLERPVGWRFSRYFPQLMDLVVFMCLTHEAMHLGQLAGWRRAMKFPSALRNL